MRNTLLAVAFVAVLAPGCSYDESGLGSTEGSPLLARLGARAVLSLEDSSQIAVVATGLDGQRITSMETEIVDGRAALRATSEGVIVVEGLEIDLSDVTVPAGIVTDVEYQVTDLQLRLGIQLGTVPTWSEDGRHAVGTGRADLLLDWSLLLDGELHPMGTRRLQSSPFEIAVDLDDDNHLRARISTSVDGELSNFLDRIVLSDLSLSVDASSAPTRE